MVHGRSFGAAVEFSVAQNICYIISFSGIFALPRTGDVLMPYGSECVRCSIESCYVVEREGGFTMQCYVEGAAMRIGRRSLSSKINCT